MKPDNRLEDTVYSNFDHKLDKSIEATLQDNPTVYASHTGWDFCGHVWYSNGKWYEEVWRYRSVVETIIGLSIMEVIKETNEKYGEV